MRELQLFGSPRRTILSLGLIGAVIALALTLTLSSVVHAAGSLSFSDAPTGWSITPGEADGNIGKVKATGVKKNRIRYAISGASGFSIKAKSGVVSYDGSAASGSEALLLVTARDRKGKVENATVTVTVSVAGATEPVVEVKRIDPVPPAAQPHEQHSAHEHVPVKVNTRRPMIVKDRSNSTLARFTADVSGGTVVTWEIVNGGDRTSGSRTFSERDGFSIRKDTGLLSYDGSGVPFAGSGSRTLTVSGQKDYYEYFLQIKATAPGYSEKTIDIRVCLLR